MPCTADSDANIYTDTLGGAHYIGQHPGSAFMEMQFHPPGFAPWPAGASCDATKWCAALNIDSLSRNSNFPVGDPRRNNNPTCLAQTGLEYVNFAFITKNGVSQAPANSKDLIADPNAVGSTPDPTKDLFMSSGDKLTVDMHDTPAGFQVVIHDLTSGQSGLMTASVANGFGQIKYAPAPSTECTVIHQAFDPCTARRARTPVCRGQRTPTTSPSRMRSGTSNTAPLLMVCQRRELRQRRRQRSRRP